jgi:hypothetical protein
MRPAVDGEYDDLKPFPYFQIFQCAVGACSGALPEFGQ